MINLPAAQTELFFNWTFYFVTVVDSQAVLKNNKRYPMYSLPSLLPVVACKPIASQGGYWQGYSQDTERFHYLRDPSYCPFYCTFLSFTLLSTALTTTNLFFTSILFVILWISYKWDHTIYNLLGLFLFTRHKFLGDSSRLL